jgi:hypothetical protein
MSTQQDTQCLTRRGTPRAAVTLIAVIALAACARQQPAAAPAPVSETVAEARAGDAALAYDCAVDAVFRSGLLLAASNPREGRLEARSALEAPGPGLSTQNGTPVDIVSVGVRPAKDMTAGARPAISVSARTVVPHYGRTSLGGSEGVTWEVILTSGRALAARRAVLETCAGDTAVRPGA